MIDRELTDNAGKKLPVSRVEQIAFDNIVLSTSHDEAVQYYVDCIDDDLLVQWATDDEGMFPNVDD